MAILHRATLEPSKPDLVRSWLPHQDWIDVPAGATIEPLGAFRFDDPDGQVGIETHLVEMISPDGTRTVVHVPLTYRNEELDGAGSALVGTLEHSVLGTRWVYDAPADPVYVAEVLRTVIEQESSVREYVDTPDGPEEREPSATAWGLLGSPLGGESGAGGIIGAGTGPQDSAEMHPRIAHHYVPHTVDGVTSIEVGGYRLAVSRFPLVTSPDSGAGTVVGSPMQTLGSLLGEWPGTAGGTDLVALLG
ncbi:maltokinase N-terminal cap-like domain-containing protein [Brevibacterium litoralis]|uniref:maltokinase N-terminal cap-like domain-containing protein n=1 Tax=Brevibacterium litoralis TaxID=3138935 RepID=UPI0032EEAEE7